MNRPVVQRLQESARFRFRRLASRTVLRDATLETMWVRQYLNASVDEILEGLGPDTLDAAEVGGDYWSRLNWASYQSLVLPDFDLVRPPEGRYWRASFDVVVCDQVLQEVVDPARALGTMVAMLRPGGTLVVSCPFLIKIDPLPGDLWRFTPEGLALLMREAGLSGVTTWGWGNRQCVRANLSRWVPRRPWRRLANEPRYPAVVWGSGRRRAGGVDHR